MKPLTFAFVLIAIAASAQENLSQQVRTQAARLDAALRSTEECCHGVDSFTSRNLVQLRLERHCRDHHVIETSSGFARSSPSPMPPRRIRVGDSPSASISRLR